MGESSFVLSIHHSYTIMPSTSGLLSYLKTLFGAVFFRQEDYAMRVSVTLPQEPSLSFLFCCPSVLEVALLRTYENRLYWVTGTLNLLSMHKASGGCSRQTFYALLASSEQNRVVFTRKCQKAKVMLWYLLYYKGQLKVEETFHKIVGSLILLRLIVF